MDYRVEWTNLDDFLGALDRSRSQIPGELPPVVEEEVEDIVQPEAVAQAPYKSGRLARSAGVERTATGADLFFSAPHAKGAAYGKFGKWSGFNRYGPPKFRFLYPAAKETFPTLVREIAGRMRGLFGAGGWFR